MLWTPRRLTLILVVLFGTLVILTALFMWRRENAASTETPQQTNEQNSAATSEAAPDPGRAFVRLEPSAGEATAGGRWNVTMQTNTWATCLADVYRPNGSIRVFDSKLQAQASPISPGRFHWTWRIPQDAESGTWTVRMLCGTHDNLATADRAVEIR